MIRTGSLFSDVIELAYQRNNNIARCPCRQSTHRLRPGYDDLDRILFLGDSILLVSKIACAFVEYKSPLLLR